MHSLFKQDELRNIFSNLAVALCSGSLQTSSWAFQLVASTAALYACGKKSRVCFSQNEIVTSNYIRSLYGHGICLFLSTNLAFPSRQTVARRMKIDDPENTDGFQFGVHKNGIKHACEYQKSIQLEGQTMMWSVLLDETDFNIHKKRLSSNCSISGAADLITSSIKQEVSTVEMHLRMYQNLCEKISKDLEKGTNVVDKLQGLTDLFYRSIQAHKPILLGKLEKLEKKFRAQDSQSVDMGYVGQHFNATKVIALLSAELEDLKTYI